MKQRIITVLILLCWSVSVQADEESKPPINHFSSQRSPSAVRLIWSLNAWPEGADRLIVQRQSAGETDVPWAAVSGPIQPGWLSDESLIDVEPDEKQLQRLIAARPNVFAKWQEPEVGQQVIVQDLGAKHPSEWDAKWTMWLGAVLRFSIHKHGIEAYDMALLTGLGCVDRSAQDKQAYTYGLFTVNQAGETSEAPLVTTAVPPLGVTGLIAEPLTAERYKRGGIVLRWALSVTVWQQAVHGFRLTRTRLGVEEKPAVIAGKTSFWQSNEDAKQQLDRIMKIDRDADVSVTYRYELTPLNLFGESMENSIVSVDYQPKASE